MVVQLMKEKGDEIKHRDFCIDEFNSNALQTEKQVRVKAGFISKVDDLELTIKTVGESIDSIRAEITELGVQLKQAAQERKKQQQEFQMTIADQRATQKLLGQALSVLKSFYASKSTPSASFTQNTQQSGAPPGFGAYKKSDNSAGVMGLLQQIIHDAKTMEAEALHSDQDAAKTYAGFVDSTNKAVEQKNTDIVHKSKIRAKAEADLVQAKDDKDAAVLELEQLSNSNAQLHASCDFITKNFDIRQTSRDEEVEALKQAKAILSGAKFTEF